MDNAASYSLWTTMVQSLAGFIYVCPAGYAQKICFQLFVIIFLSEAEIIKCVMISTAIFAVLPDSTTTFFLIEPDSYKGVHASLSFASVWMLLKPVLNEAQLSLEI